MLALRRHSVIFCSRGYNANKCFYGTSPKEILEKQKMTAALTLKMIQDAAKKYINLNSYIIATLKPNKQTDKPLKGF